MQRTAVVIGGGRIGSAIAWHLARGGFTVAVAAHADIELTQPDSVREYLERFDRIDLLVNAAGTYGAIGTVRDVSPQSWAQAVDVNLMGVYATCHYALPRLARRGHIINIAGGGRGPQQLRSGYVAAKSALWRFTETLAAEEPGLCINAIAPGPMESRMQQAARRVPELSAEIHRVLRRSVPIANTLRAVDHIIETEPTGQLLFAREFSECKPLRLAVSGSA